MAVTWTKEQQQVINLRNRNLLVSAAAGSGKTAVLVERILTKIMDEKHPIDIDQLLIVTFTKAAASEMRERIRLAIEKELSLNPENEHLQRQSTLIHHAKISTIHGFCSYIIKNYYYLIDLDPGYRVSDEGELKLIKGDVVHKVMESAYDEKAEDFLRFSESFASGRNDKELDNLVLELYEYASSAPWPKEWLDSCAAAYEVETLDKNTENEQPKWLQLFWENIQLQIMEAENLNEENYKRCQLQNGPYMYIPALDNLSMLIDELKSTNSYRGFVEAFQKHTTARLSSKKDESVEPSLRDAAKNAYHTVKMLLDDLESKYFKLSEEAVLESLCRCRGSVSVLVSLTKSFMDAYEAEKRKKNILDFSDLEHLALDILAYKDEKGIHRSQAAIDLASQFEEIMIDEYQDSNLVQELLLGFVSRISEGIHNVFMVGDVKQSIYRFRLARPELFMDKLKSYTLTDSEKQRIDLHKNFRSRQEVVDAVNLVFEQVMGASIGNVVYDDEAALYYGANYPEDQTGFAKAEAICINLEDFWQSLETDTSKEACREMEARAIGMKIRKIVGMEQVYDNKLQTYRKAEYGDCVILLRTISGWSDAFVRVLKGMGIPAYATSKSGYFSALEVTTIMNYLYICDNPRQEIPFCAVLLSPIGNLTDEDLAVLRAADADRPIYENARSYVEEGTNPVLQHKLKLFWNTYDEIGEKISYTSIQELLELILEKTGYQDYAASLPDGAQREANLLMLKERAMDYEKTSYRGLFHFIRYIEQLKKYSIDFGEVNMVGEHENTVRIMSIHKSKGLEFPIVFVGGMGKMITAQETRGNVVVHTDYGIGVSDIDPVVRTKFNPLIKNVISDKLKEENAGEELRILYVAMTRAKEKLILTGSIKDFEKDWESYKGLEKNGSALLPYHVRADASCYWDWVLPAICRREEQGKIDLVVENPASLLLNETVEETRKNLTKEKLVYWNTDQVYNLDMKETLERTFSYVYPYDGQKDMPAKVSVSELKKKSMEDEESHVLYEQSDTTAIIPRFMQKEDAAYEGAARGTAYHKVLECLHMDQISTREELSLDLAELYKTGKIEEEIYRNVDQKDIWAFLQSDIGQRMCAASKENRLYREQQFVLGIPASQLRADYGSEETVLVQGIIDAFFYEADGIVLLDYKTDKVFGNDGSQLLEKYHVQLEYYAEALTRLTKKPVNEIYIYSFTLGKELVLSSKESG